MNALLKPKIANSEENGNLLASEEKQLPSRVHDWTDLHSFYALMGGFAFSDEDLSKDKRFLPGNRSRVILTSDGLLRLAEHEPALLPDLSKAEIIDKSKADGFGKTIVCLQASWFIMQTCSRFTAQLPISLLELSTMAHAICALLIYFLWWNKPLDIRQPTLMTGQSTHGVAATFCFYSPPADNSSRWECIILSRIMEGSKEPSPTMLLPHDKICNPTAAIRYCPGGEGHPIGKIYDGESIAGFTYLPKWYTYRKNRFYAVSMGSSSLSSFGILRLKRDALSYSSSGVRRWKLAYTSLPAWQDTLSKFAIDGCVTPRINNWPSKARFGISKIIKGKQVG